MARAVVTRPPGFRCDDCRPNSPLGQCSEGDLYHVSLSPNARQADILPLAHISVSMIPGSMTPHVSSSPAASHRSSGSTLPPEGGPILFVAPLPRLPPRAFCLAPPMNSHLAPVLHGAKQRREYDGPANALRQRPGAWLRDACPVVRLVCWYARRSCRRCLSDFIPSG